MRASNCASATRLVGPDIGGHDSLPARLPGRVPLEKALRLLPPETFERAETPAKNKSQGGENDPGQEANRQLETGQ